MCDRLVSLVAFLILERDGYRLASIQMRVKCAIWRDGDYKSGGIPIANFMSPLELQRFIGYKSLEDSTQDFYLTVAPGADVAFCIAFVLAVREMEKSYGT